MASTSLSRTGRVALALVAALVGAEICLQLAALVVGLAVAPRGDVGTARRADLTILCVGDSHTYGLPLPVEESYPAQLEATLAARHPDVDVQVVNLGIPGLNSAFVANRLERQLLQLRPDVVIVWVGVNNRWNAIETNSSFRDRPAAELRRLLMHSRLFRLASIAWHSGTGYQYDPEQRGGWYEGELPPSGRDPDGKARQLADKGLRRDLARMTATARSLETPILFVGYPLQQDNGTNRAIEQMSRALRVPAIETSVLLRRALRDGHAYDSLIDDTRGPHPTGRLYRYVVDAIVPVVEAAVALSPPPPTAS